MRHSREFEAVLVGITIAAVASGAPILAGVCGFLFWMSVRAG